MKAPTALHLQELGLSPAALLERLAHYEGVAVPAISPCILTARSLADGHWAETTNATPTTMAPQAKNIRVPAA